MIKIASVVHTQETLIPLSWSDRSNFSDQLATIHNKTMVDLHRSCRSAAEEQGEAAQPVSDRHGQRVRPGTVPSAAGIAIG